MVRPGKFIKTLIPFKDDDGDEVSPEDQARQILNIASAFLNNGSHGVYLTYSSDFEQTLDIIKTYQDGGWSTNVNGSHQAATIAALESLLGLEYIRLQRKVRIAPITTMSDRPITEEDKTGFANKTHLEVIEEDLDRIRSDLDGGWDVLGWVNQQTDPDFAVGGGAENAENPNFACETQFPAHLQSFVRKRLASFDIQYV